MIMQFNLINSVQKDSSAIVLLLSNLLTIVLAVVFNWSLIIILWSYWLQSVIIGFFSFIKILSLQNFSTEGFKSNGRSVLPTTATKISTAFFFAFHYGFFHLVYALFLLTFSFVSQSISLTDFGFVFLSGIIFFVNHLFSFNYFKNKTQKKQNLGTVMMFPYLRIVPMHLTIIFGGFFLVSATASLPILVFFLILKTIADLGMHTIEHKEQI